MGRVWDEMSPLRLGPNLQRHPQLMCSYFMVRYTTNIYVSILNTSWIYFPPREQWVIVSPCNKTSELRCAFFPSRIPIRYLSDPLHVFMLIFYIMTTRHSRSLISDRDEVLKKRWNAWGLVCAKGTWIGLAKLTYRLVLLLFGISKPLGIICLDEEVFYFHLLRRDRLINKFIRNLKLALAHHDSRVWEKKLNNNKYCFMNRLYQLMNTRTLRTLRNYYNLEIIWTLTN